MDNTRILKIDQPDGWEVLHCKHLTVTHFQAWGNFSDKEIFDYQASGSLCTCTVRHRQQEHQMPRMNSNSQNHLDVLQYYRFPSQGNYEVYMIACKAEGEQFGARRFAKVRLLTTAHEYTHHQVRLLLQNHVLKIQECRKHSCNPKWSKVYPKHSDFHEIAPKKKRATIAWAQGVVLGSFHCPSVVFFGVRASGPEPSSESFPFVDLPTMRWLQGSCYMLVCSTQLWMPVTWQWGSRFCFTFIDFSIIFGDSISKKVSRVIWVMTVDIQRQQISSALGSGIPKGHAQERGALKLSACPTKEAQNAQKFHENVRDQELWACHLLLQWSPQTSN